MATAEDAAAEVAAIESAGAPSLPADTASDDAPLNAPLREDQVANAVSFLTSPKACCVPCSSDAVWACEWMEMYTSAASDTVCVPSTLVAATDLTSYNLCMQVAPASTEQKRSFLIKKGLTVGEIDEAFRRAPDAPAAAAVAPAPAAPHATTVSPYAAPSPPGQQQVWLHCA